MKKAELEEVLLRFSYKEENEHEAQSYFTIFYREYSRYIFTVVRVAKKSAPYFYDDLVDIVVKDTFLKIYNNPLDFIINESETDDEVDKKMKGYLAVVAKNELKRLLNKEYCKQEHYLKIDDDEILFDPPEVIISTEEDISYHQKVLQEILATFSERDRLILLAIYDCHVEGKNTPSETLNWLVKTYKTTKVNIRKIKSRCDKKIIEYFEQKTKLKPLKR